MKFSEKAYEARLEVLFEKHPSVSGAGFTPGAYKPGMEGMEGFDTLLGHPWKEFECIHVAGTNGKGSVSSMLAAALAARGLKVGLYTSPHLLDFRERMKIITPDGFGMISKREVWDFLEAFPTDGLSFFEITTGMAFRWFADKGVDMAVIEVGLGGRLDSTNIITPVLSVVTSIGLDHCAQLGDSRAMIAGEKAGIFKPGVPAVVWGRDAETGPVFERIARERGSTLVYADSRDASAPFPDEAALLRRMDLQGPCQEVNLRTVLCALKVLQGEVARSQLDAIAGTAARTGFHGRWERIGTDPETICDIAHNPQALELNFTRLSAIGRPLSIVFGIMADKDLDAVAPLFPKGSRCYLAAPLTPRALPAEELLRRLGRLRPDLDARAFPSVREALVAARREAAADALVYVGGSNYVVSEIIEI